MGDIVADLADRASNQHEELPALASTVGTELPLRTEELLGLHEQSHGDVTALFSAEGLLGYVSAACETMFGWEPSELIGYSLDDFIHPEDLSAIQFTHIASLRSPKTYVATCRLRCKDGGYLWTESVLTQVVHPRDTRRVLLMASIRDIADRKLVEARLERQALTDPLTGIANRTVFMDRLQQGLLRLDRTNKVLAVIYLDLDRFKVVNDLLGHERGDRLLMKVAERTLGALRLADTLARLGGDEFVVLAEGLSTVEEAKRLAVRICKGIEEPFELDGRPIVCTASAGVATTSDSAYGAVNLVQEADLALYRAKDRGRNRAEVFDEELRSTAIGRLGVERRIRSAIDEGRLRVQYQPIVDLQTGYVASVEALLRIQEQGELVLPDVFLHVAEETGLLVTMDEQVFSDAIRQAARWSRQRSTRDFGEVTINVTGRHLANSHFLPVVAEALAMNELEPGCLGIEVTERVLMEASNSAMESLRAVRALGVKVGLDDFGTGYSSLAYLRRFPLDYLKIDQSFVRDLGEASDDLAMVTAIIELAHALHLTVIAEGVETEVQLRTLIRLGCDRAQGFLFGRAEDPDALFAVLDHCFELSGREPLRGS